MFLSLADFSFSPKINEIKAAAKSFLSNKDQSSLRQSAVIQVLILNLRTDWSRVTD